MKTLKNEKGFTLVELVVVIVVLGLLAAFAVPRFIDITTAARTSSVNGFAGGLRAAVAVVKAQYMINGTFTSPVAMADGTNVIVSTGATGGIPTGAAGGIGSALTDLGGFTPSYATPTSTFDPPTGGSATCRVSYNDTTGVVSVVTTGC